MRLYQEQVCLLVPMHSLMQDMRPAAHLKHTPVSTAIAAVHDKHPAAVHALHTSGNPTCNQAAPAYLVMPCAHAPTNVALMHQWKACTHV